MSHLPNDPNDPFNRFISVTSVKPLDYRKGSVKSIEFIVDDLGNVWVNINEECVLRVKRAEGVYIDNRWGYAHEEDGASFREKPHA